MKFITITGIDKSGKTTLINAFMEKTCHEHYVIDRSPDTFAFFNEIRDRVKDSKQMNRYYEFNNNFKRSLDLAILIYGSPDVIEERFKEHNEPKLVGDYSYKEHMEKLEEFFDNANYLNTLKINTSTHTIDECVTMIERKIECL